MLSIFTAPSADQGFIDFGQVGPQTDGTYDIPVEAQQVNDPSAAAGYPAAADGNSFDILKYGVGAIADIYKFQQGLDYKRFEATQGGVFQQGRSVNVPRTASGGLSSKYVLIAAVLIGLFVLTSHKG